MAENHTWIIRNCRIMSQSNVKQPWSWYRWLVLSSKGLLCSTGAYCSFAQNLNSCITNHLHKQWHGKKLESALAWFSTISAFFSLFQVKQTRQKTCVRPADSMQTQWFCTEMIRWDSVECLNVFWCLLPFTPIRNNRKSVWNRKKISFSVIL